MDKKKFLEDVQKCTIEELVSKYNLTFNELFNLTKQLQTPYKSKFNYIRKTPSKSYSIVKLVNGEHVYFGSYKDENEAIIIRDELIKCGWDKKELPRILDEFNITSKCGE